ncbi:MAG: hypothetical protein ACXW3Z_15920, partial [Limisphaerales bacterium]
FIGLEGSSNSIQFVCTSVPQMARWIVNTNETVALPPTTDLKRISYRLLGGTNVVERKGLDRTEELLLGSAFTAGTNATEFIDTAATNLTSALTSDSSATNQLAAARLPLTDKIQHLQFRYWSGTNWLDSWGGLDLPRGIEVTVGSDPIPVEGGASVTEGYPFEFFRRVIFLPNSDHPDNAVVSETEEFLL